MVIEIVEPDKWPEVRDSLPEASFLWERLVPSGGTTLLHGPPGCGKSALAWGIANAVAVGAPYLGLSTVQARVLLVSTDMNLYEYKLRWGDAFLPSFAFCCIPKSDWTSNDVRITEEWRKTRVFVEGFDNSPTLVVLDALGGFHAGKSSKDDEVATLLDGAFEAWLPGVAKLIIAHDRKGRYGQDGSPVEPGPEDLMGSQLWRANATSQLHMWKTGRHHSTLRQEKSQVSACLEHELPLYIDMFGRAELWNEKRAQEVIGKTKAAFRKLALDGLPAGEQAKRLALEYGISERTAWRWLSLAREI